MRIASQRLNSARAASAGASLSRQWARTRASVSTPPLPTDCSIEAAQPRTTIDSLRAVFERVRADPKLRSRLQWDNGVLAEPPPAAREVFDARIDWPDAYWFASAVLGGFGFFLATC
jgi:hypothetical protein